MYIELADARVGKQHTTATIRLEPVLVRIHHHGVGVWHAPWLGAEVGERGAGLVETAGGHMDPAGILNPGVLLDQTDRLEA